MLFHSRLLQKQHFTIFCSGNKRDSLDVSAVLKKEKKKERVLGKHASFFFAVTSKKKEGRQCEKMKYCFLGGLPKVNYWFSYCLGHLERFTNTANAMRLSHPVKLVQSVISSGTDEVWAKREPSRCNESVNGHFLVKSVSKLYLQEDLICQNIHLVSYRQVPGSIPGRGSIDFFPLFLSFLTRFPFCSTPISKVGKWAAFQLRTPTYFTYEDLGKTHFGGDYCVATY